MSLHVSGNMSSLTPLSCPHSLFSSCCVAVGSWLTAGQLWMLALYKGCCYPSLGFVGLEQLSAAGEALVRRPSPIRGQSSTTGFLDESQKAAFLLSPALLAQLSTPLQEV